MPSRLLIGILRLGLFNCFRLPRPTEKLELEVVDGSVEEHKLLLCPALVYRLSRAPSLSIDCPAGASTYTMIHVTFAIFLSGLLPIKKVLYSG